MLSVAILTAATERSGHDRAGSTSLPFGHLLAVCDGAGGSGGAAGAAEQVCAFLCGMGPSTGVRASLVDAIRRIDRHLPASGVHGLTTCVVALVHDGVVEGASVGDSEAWLVTANDYFVLTEHQARRPLVGSGRSKPTAFGPVALRGTLVLGSDGLFKYCSPDRIVSIVRSNQPTRSAELLLESVRLPGGTLPDDFAVVLGRRLSLSD